MLTKKIISGFTLVEMAIVLMIIGLLLGGLIPTLSAQMESQRITETRKSLGEIQDALIGFAIINGRLPCPADGTIATGQANAGVEAIAGTTCSNVANNAAAGVLPWATLGVSETDGWGRRFTYRVTTVFADAISANTFGGGCTPSPAPTQSSFALCSSGNLNVLSAASGGTNVAIDTPLVLISHGKNGCGAYLSTGNPISIAEGDSSGDNCNNAGADQVENSDGSADNNYVSHTPTPNFDDLVAWLSPNTLLNRMVTSGKLP